MAGMAGAASLFVDGLSEVPAVGLSWASEATMTNDVCLLRTERTAGPRKGLERAPKLVIRRWHGDR